MKKILISAVVLCLIFGCLELFSQTTSSTRTTSSRTGSRTSSTGGTTTYGYGTTANADFVVATVAGMLRHPNKEVRMQVLQSLVGGMTLGSTTSTSSSSTTTKGIGDIFALRGGTTRTSGSSTSTTSTEGLGSTVFIPEFFTMLADPDPQIRDLVSIALDQIFGTDASLIRFMNDPDPVVRKYAIRLFVIRAQTSDQYRTTTTSSSSNTNYVRSSNDILVMRILLNMIKDPDPDVRKVASDALEKFISDLEQRYQATMQTTQQQGLQPGR